MSCPRQGRMRGDGRIYQRGAVFFTAYSINGREFRESTRSREWGDAPALLERRLRPHNKKGPETRAFLTFCVGN
jgi:hypothetical protein